MKFWTLFFMILFFYGFILNDSISLRVEISNKTLVFLIFGVMKTGFPAWD